MKRLILSKTVVNTISSELESYLQQLVKHELKFMAATDFEETDLYLWANRVLKGDVPPESMLRYFKKYYDTEFGYRHIIAKLEELVRELHNYD